jgi:hypothetical protein
MWGSVSDERTGLSFTIAAGSRQRSHSRVWVPWNSRPYFTVSDWRLPFRRLLRLAGLRWKYSTPPPHGFQSFRCVVVFHGKWVGPSRSFASTGRLAWFVVCVPELRSAPTQMQPFSFIASISNRAGIMWCRIVPVQVVYLQRTTTQNKADIQI